ncbi:acyltransferase [Spiractinospora alimapuensis]|nr:acyltransferase [Spiractinospora alimapuensis]
MVLVFHVAVESGTALVPGLRGALFSGLELAVPLFFGLSGILLYRPWARATLYGTPAPRAGAYLWRRALRVLPAYWLVAVAALLLYSREYLASVRVWLEVLTLSFVYTPDPWYEGIGPRGLGQIWSLCVEVAFYVLLPVLAYLLHRVARGGSDVDARARRLLVGLGVVIVFSVAVLVVQFYPEHRPQMHMWLPRTLGMFAAGMALAVISEWAWKEPDRDGPVRRFCHTLATAPATCWLVALGAYLVTATPATGVRFAGADSIWPAVAQSLAALVFAFFFLAPITFLPMERPSAAERWRGSGAWLHTLMTGPVMAWLAKVSYGVFLWQFIVLYLWRDFTSQEPFTGSMLLDLGPVVLGTLVLAALTHRFVELPTRRAYHLLAVRDRPTSPQSESPASESSRSSSSEPSSASVSDSASAQGSPSDTGTNAP